MLYCEDADELEDGGVAALWSSTACRRAKIGLTAIGQPRPGCAAPDWRPTTCLILEKAVESVGTAE